MSERHLPFWPARVPRQLTIPATSLWFNVEVSATRYPGKPLHIFYDRTLTYADFKAEAERLAGFLQRECAVQRGDRVALYLQNCPQFALAYYAVLRANAVVVPINSMLLTQELAGILEDCGAQVLISAQELYGNVEPLQGRTLAHTVIACYRDYVDPDTRIAVPAVVAAERQRIGGAGVTLWSDALRPDLKPGAALAGSDDLCVLPYTSGTTGVPKGCVHKHRSVQFTAMAGPHWYRIFQDETSLAVLPWFHVTGMQSSLNGAIYSGATVVIQPRWDRDLAGELIQRYRVSTWGAVPAMVVDFLSNPRIEQYDLSSIRHCGGGGAAMPQAIAQKMQDLCGITFMEGYGSTETMAPSHINPPERPKQQCLGIPIFHTDSRVVDPDSGRELPPGETGEIITHGPGVFEGYWNKPNATREAFVELDGKRFFRTGDLGRTDEDGYFFMVDRLKRMINAAGFKVWPAEVEALLYAHPGIEEAVVIAKKDARRGETVKALVVLKPAARAATSAEAIIEWARGQMAAYKVPRIVEFVERLPKSAAGKVQWRTLQEREDALASNE